MLETAREKSQSSDQSIMLDGLSYVWELLPLDVMPCPTVSITATYPQILQVLKVSNEIVCYLWSQCHRAAGSLRMWSGQFYAGKWSVTGFFLRYLPTASHYSISRCHISISSQHFECRCFASTIHSQKAKALNCKIYHILEYFQLVNQWGHKIWTDPWNVIQCYWTTYLSGTDANTESVHCRLASTCINL